MPSEDDGFGWPGRSNRRPRGARSSARLRLLAQVVEAARSLYVTAADRTVAKARREKRWADVARTRRAQAAAVYAAAGLPVPPPDDAVDLHRDAMVALLKSFASPSAGAELVSAGCCKACRADDGKVFKDLPGADHEAAPARGLLAWDLCV